MAQSRFERPGVSLDWTRSGAPPPLGAADVHLYRTRLEAPADRLAELRGILNDAERARADRFRFEVHRNRFIAGRGWLREILAAYLEIAPNTVTFGYGPQGKPRLAGELADSDLRFNLSHSDDLALLAVCRNREVGADVERLRPGVDVKGIARRFFSQAEADIVLAQPETDQAAAFFRCWTRKEAFIKALGGGLSIPLDGFEVPLDDTIDGAPIATPWAPAEADRWRLHEASPEPGFAGAVVVARGPARLVPLDRPVGQRRRP